MKRKDFSTQTRSLNCENLSCRGQKSKWLHGKKSGEISLPLTTDHDELVNDVAREVSGWPSAGGYKGSLGKGLPWPCPSFNIVTGQEQPGLG